MAGFLDKMVEGLNRGVSTVSEGSKNIVEKANLNTQIRDLEKEKNVILQNMGTLVYNLQARGEISIDQCADMCSEIAARDMRIMELQEHLRALEVPKPAQYTAQTVTSSATNGVTCQCGFVNKEGAKFCAKCGTQII